MVCLNLLPILTLLPVGCCETELNTFLDEDAKYIRDLHRQLEAAPNNKELTSKFAVALRDARNRRSEKLDEERKIAEANLIRIAEEQERRHRESEQAEERRHIENKLDRLLSRY